MTEPKIAPWIIEAHEKQTELEFKGRPNKVRVLGILQGATMPVIVAVKSACVEYMMCVDGDGKEGEIQRLVPPRQTRKMWANLYDKERIFPPGWRGTLYHSREDADRAADGPNRIACVPIEITFTPGEGLT